MILLRDYLFTSGVRVLLLLTLFLCVVLSFSFSGAKAWRLGLTLYDELHWAEGKYQAFWRDGKASDNTEQGCKAICWV